MREKPIVMETRIGRWRRGTAPLEEYFAIDQTYPDMLELDILPHKTSIGIEGGVSAVYEFPVTLPG